MNGKEARAGGEQAADERALGPQRESVNCFPNAKKSLLFRSLCGLRRGSASNEA